LALEAQKEVMKTVILIVLVFVFYGDLFAQELILDDGIYIEKPDHTNKEKHRYSRDNISYKLNRRFIFDYYYIDGAGVKRKFLLSNNETSVNNPLNLAGGLQRTDSTIDKIKLVITDSVETFPNYDSTYTQTVVSYEYIVKNSKAGDTLCACYQKKYAPARSFLCSGVSTGAIDNYKNLWIHPPRQFTFRILQFNPFPFYYRDEKVKHWSWHVEISGIYLDPRWVNTKENVKMKFDYERQRDEVISGPFGKIKCKVTRATGTAAGNGFAKTYLKSYYHPKLGFVRLEYTNINGSKMVIQLIKVEG